MENNVYMEGTDKNIGTGNDIFGKERCRVALVVKEILNDIDAEWFLDAGSLLGAYRNGKMIDRDDDFDTGILIRNGVQSLSNELSKLYDIFNQKLPSSLGVREITGYSYKLEIFDPAFGKYVLAAPFYNGADFHYVTVDVQTFVENEANVMSSTHTRSPFELPVEVVVPTRSMILEGEEYPCPQNAKEYLVTRYGCIEEGAKFDEVTRMFFK